MTKPQKPDVRAWEIEKKKQSWSARCTDSSHALMEDAQRLGECAAYIEHLEQQAREQAGIIARHQGGIATAMQALQQCKASTPHIQD